MNTEGISHTECIYCGEETAKHIKNLPFQGIVNEERISFRGPGWQCTKCGETWATAEDLEKHDKLKADTYRKREGLMQAKDMEQSRIELGLTKIAFCDMLQITRMTYDRWLNGLVQGEAMDQAIRAKLDQKVAAINNLQLLWRELSLKSKEFRGNAEPNLAKLTELIAHFLRLKGSKKLGMLYLNKLTWYVDQASFNRFGESVTGTVYVALEHGPVIASYDQVFRVMEFQGLIHRSGENDYAVTEDLNFSNLSTRDCQLAEFVWNQFKNRLSQLRNKSHDEKGWEKTDALEYISYSLSNPLKHLNERDLDKLLS